MDLHHPLVPPEPYFSLFGKEIPGERRDIDPDWRFRRHKNFQGTKFRQFRDHKLALYDGALRFLDGEIGRLLDALEQLGLAEETLIILTSDHGEEFWDHARQERALSEDPRGRWGVGHGHSMYQELLWIPLILRGPGIEAAHRIRCQARLIDIAPTVLDMLGLPMPDGMRGVSLHPLVAADATSAACKPGVSLAESPAYGPDSKAIVYGKFKLVRRQHGASQLFDLEADPSELKDLAEVHPEVIAELTELMNQELAGADDSDSEDVMEFDSSTLEQLKTLGYVD